jgi:uncharacterized iron-regulated membrane protein
MGTQLGIVSRTLMTLVCAGLLTSTGSALVMFRDASGPVG